MEVKSALIIGGTGTLGKALIQYLHGLVDITILSRDEHKQQALKKVYPDIRFILGDIKDPGSLDKAFLNQDAVFHFAALKHVDALEDNPVEAMKTNAIASVNVADMCLKYHVPVCVYSSTDKAVYPINSYGYSKALSEKIFLDYNKHSDYTRFNVYRWPNVIGSQGSAIPFFINKINAGESIPVTDVKMTRFWIKIEEAVQFVLKTYKSGFRQHNTIIYPRLKSASILDVIDVLAEILGKPYRIHEIGLRPGEKLHECMVADHEGEYLDSLTAIKYTRPELKELLAGLCRS